MNLDRKYRELKAGVIQKRWSLVKEASMDEGTQVGVETFSSAFIRGKGKQCHVWGFFLAFDILENFVQYVTSIRSATFLSFR